MAKIPHTTVVLSEKAQKVKEDLAPIFGLKNILSAGLLLLSKLTAEQKQSTIAEANGDKLKMKCPKCGHVISKKRKKREDEK